MRKTSMTLAVVLVASAQALATEASDAIAQLDAAEVRWQRSAPSAYEFRFEYGAMLRYVDCEEGFRAIVANQVTVEPPGCNQLRGTFATIPVLFTYIRQELLKAPDSVKVMFNPQYGYPESFDIDYRKNISDDEFRFAVRDFRSLDKNAPPNATLERTRGR